MFWAAIADGALGTDEITMPTMMEGSCEMLSDTHHTPGMKEAPGRATADAPSRAGSTPASQTNADRMRWWCCLNCGTLHEGPERLAQHRQTCNRRRTG